jgi:hypothetical protein
MTWLRSCALALAFVCASTAFSQDTSCLRRTVPLGIVTVPGAPITQIASSDLRAEFRGKPAQILALSGHVHPRRVLILLDASGSMQGPTGALWSASVYVADQFAQSNLASTSLGLFIFGKRAGEQIPFSQGNAAVQRRLRDILADPKYAKEHVYGMTPLRDAILEGVKMFGTPGAGDAILVVSDGGENASRSKESALPVDLLANGIRLFSCIIRAHEGGPTSEERGDTGDLRELAATTGGLAVEPFRGQTSGDVAQFFAGHSSPVQAALLTLDKQITDYGLVEFVLPSSVTKRERWTLSLTKEKSRELKGAKLLYPQELLPCKATGSHETVSTQHP